MVIDYYNIDKWIPPTVYNKVWNDNHKFMFERHLYNEDFFKFINDVCNVMNLPTMPQNHKGFIHPDHSKQTEESRKMIQNLIIALGNFIFYFLSRAYDNNCIGDLANRLKTLLSLVPDQAHVFFDHFVCKDAKNSLELLLNCPDRQVRYYSSQVILHSINVMIEYYGFKLDLEKLKQKQEELSKLPEDQQQTPETKSQMEKCKIEESILYYFKLLINFMPTEVAKNWMKFK